MEHNILDVCKHASINNSIIVNPRCPYFFAQTLMEIVNSHFHWDLRLDCAETLFDRYDNVLFGLCGSRNLRNDDLNWLNTILKNKKSRYKVTHFTLKQYDLASKKGNDVNLEFHVVWKGLRGLEQQVLNFRFE